MAQNAAPVSGIYFDRIGNKRKPESWAGKKVADDGLEVTVDQSAARRECGKPFEAGLSVRIPFG